ncbi:helix-turn-helix domain-containing protein [Brevibacillus laterosporus]|uniref:helix-turn-helix domain-containing protein n=1 Tax=Brevibacillus laterosporus TaxID=1465 RepID=UPI003D1910FE
MIKCNLAVLLAERGLKIVDVAKATGISKTTLGALYHNSGKGVQFETLNSLCKYLNVSISDLFTHHIFNIVLENYEWIDDQTIELYCKIRLDETISNSIFRTVITQVDFNSQIDIETTEENQLKFNTTVWHTDSKFLSVPDSLYISYSVDILVELLENKYKNISLFQLNEFKQMLKPNSNDLGV